MLEGFKFKTYGELFENAKLEEIYEFAKIVFSKEAFINKGDFSKVYQDFVNEACYKVFTRPDQIRNPEEEASILDDVRDLNNLGFARAPFSLFSVIPLKELDKESLFKYGFFWNAEN